jgi:fumarate reductase subunit D
LAAFKAGTNPEIIVTTIVVIIVAIIANQGVVNENSSKEAIK